MNSMIKLSRLLKTSAVPKHNIMSKKHYRTTLNEVKKTNLMKPSLT